MDQNVSHITPVNVLERKVHRLDPGDDERTHALSDLLAFREEEDRRELRPALRVPAQRTHEQVGVVRRRRHRRSRLQYTNL